MWGRSGNIESITLEPQQDMMSSAKEFEMGSAAEQLGRSLSCVLHVVHPNFTAYDITGTGSVVA